MPAPTAGAASTAPASPSIFDEDPSTLTPPQVPDRIEGFNRAVFKFNDVLYKAILRPIGKGYAAVVPVTIRRGIGHFFNNLAFPTRFVGNVLEGRFNDAGVETERFAINTFSSFGFCAFTDDSPRLRERTSDLGLAFGSWGIGHGTYLILPLLGPSSVRDGIGLGISGYFLDPVHYIDNWKYRTGATALLVVNQAPEQMDAYDQLKAATIDPYVALRDAYSARRNHRLADDTLVPVVPAAAATVPKL